MSAGRTSRSSICEIRPHIYISGYRALSPQKIKELGITHAVDIANIYKSHRAPNVKYFEIKIDDDGPSDIKQYFDKVIAFIQKAKDCGGKTLVYCAAGVSRSATICIMYLMISENISLRNAFNEVKRVRPIIYPNLSFWQQMVEYEIEKRGEASIEMVSRGKQFIPDVYLSKNIETED